MIEFKMPSLGADMEDGTLLEWRVKPGDSVQRGDIIAEVDTQKGLIEIEVFDEGIIKELMIQENQKVPVGTTMALIESASEEQKNEPLVSEPILAEAVTKPVSQSIGKEGIKISPLARKIAEMNHIDLKEVKGSGEHGEIHKSDIEDYLAHKENGATVEKATPKENIGAPPKEGMRQAIAAATSRSNMEIPHYYLEMDIDMTASLEWLSKFNKECSIQERVLPVVLFIKAVGKALRDVPELNATWEDQLILKESVNIALATSLRDGGVVLPTLYDADKKSIKQIMKDLSEIILRAKSSKLRSSDLVGSTISITSIGDNGAEKISGVIFPPHVAIIGFGAIRQLPWAENGTIEARPAVTVTLAADHRATDGYSGSRFLKELKRYLSKPDEL